MNITSMRLIASSVIDGHVSNSLSSASLLAGPTLLTSSLHAKAQLWK